MQRRPPRAPHDHRPLPGLVDQRRAGRGQWLKRKINLGIDPLQEAVARTADAVAAREAPTLVRAFIARIIEGERLAAA